MSIIQDIRDKYAKLTVVLIALALVGFILTDYFAGQSRAGGGNVSNTVGVVNGKKILFEEFNSRVNQVEEQMKAQGYPQTAALTQQAIEQTWNQEISRLLLVGEFEKLGIEVGKKELGDILYGVNAPQDIKQQFTDQQTAQFNPALAKQNIDQMLKKGTPEQKANISSYINQLADLRMAEKYNSLLANSINFPRWMVEKQNADNSQAAKISLVREVYSSIPDSSIKVDDSEIASYINKNKSQFKQQESRNISYVTFSAVPSAKDSAEVKDRLAAQKEAFKTTENLEQYLAGEGANYYSGYINGKTIQIALKDSIFKTPVGEVYGPYLDGGSYSLARVLGVRQMPDTVKVRHILIGMQTRDSAMAYTLADSLKNEIAKGSSFDSLAAKFSEDPGSKDKGGLYESVPSGQMVPPFNDFIFLNPVGTKGIVKTDFGVHYIEILSQKGNGAAYKIAYLPKEIIASQETDNAALNDANAFAGDSRDQKSFDANFEKTLKPKGIQKGVATDITPAASEIRGLGLSRSFVRSIYEAEKGEVLKPERIENNYVVAVVTDIFEEGTMDASRARVYVEPVLRNKKKAEILKKKIGKVTTLEAAAAVLGGKTIETADSIRINSSLSSSLGYEPRVTGAAFNPANKGKVVPEVLEGQNGVYVVRVDNVFTTPVTEGDVNSQRTARYQQAKQGLNNQYSPNNPLSILRNAATIKDRRSNRY